MSKSLCVCVCVCMYVCMFSGRLFKASYWLKYLRLAVAMAPILFRTMAPAMQELGRFVGAKAPLELTRCIH